MKLVMSFSLVLLLVLTGVARSLWSDDSDKIASAAKSGSAEALSEASESCDDDRLIGSFPLAFPVTSSDVFLIATPLVSQTSVELNLIKDNSRIYKLTSKFLI
jgi:hypothetical protein